MNTVQLFIEDIRKALDSDCLFAALSLALSIPDICGKIKYPNEKSSKRYIEWIDEYLSQSEKNSTKDVKVKTYLSGELLYKVRCAFFHEGTNDLNVNKKDDLKFVRFIECGKTNIEIYNDSFLISSNCININIRNICYKIILCAEKFLNDECHNKELPQLKTYNLDEEYNKITNKR